MDLGLGGKKAIVTGGSRGIGRAIVERLAGEGCAVALCARDGKQVDDVVTSLKSGGATAFGASVDVRDREAVTSWIDAAASQLGGVDICVANVSALAGAPDEESWRAGLEVDILGTIRTIEAALPHIERSDAGAIVSIASTAALEAFGGVRAYNSIKAALINHMSNLATALAPMNIRANTVSPGTIFFEGGVWDIRKRDQPEVYAMAMERNPTGRMGTPEEVANATVFLASPAAGFITGANLVVDGGLTRRVQF